MFGVGRFEDLLGERRLRATAIGVAVGCIILATSAGYTVQTGDTLAEIARKHGTTVSALVGANDIANANLIRTGQVLTIPGTDRTHKVTNGESLSEIAARYRVTIAALVRANDLADPDIIRIGQTLTVPVAGGGGSPGGSGATTTTHVVKAGETLGSIAARYGTTVGKLAELNRLSNPSLIITGSTLKVSVSGSGGSSGDTGETNHKVKPGETLSGIAARYGTTTAAIVGLNGLSSADTIRIGQTLRIPAAGGQGGGGSSTGMRCPVPRSRFVNDYGYIKPDGRFHQGIDLFAPMGTSVHAPVAGRVEAVNGTLGGLQFWLHGDDGNLYIGTHLRGFGQVGRVAAGTVIGTVGDTGNAIGAPPHLHFEILEDGKTVNPYHRLVAACR